MPDSLHDATAPAMTATPTAEVAYGITNKMFCQ